jgi:hypothetical protein
MHNIVIAFAFFFLLYFPEPQQTFYEKFEPSHNHFTLSKMGKILLTTRLIDRKQAPAKTGLALLVLCILALSAMALMVKAQATILYCGKLSNNVLQISVCLIDFSALNVQFADKNPLSTTF